MHRAPFIKPARPCLSTRVAAGSIRAQVRKLTIVFWDEKFVYFRENRRVYEL